MSEQVYLKALDITALAELQISSGEIDLHLSEVQYNLAKTLPEACGWKTFVRDNVVTSPVQHWTRKAIRATDVCTMAHWLISKKQWKVNRPFFETVTKANVYLDDQLVAGTAWLAGLAAFVASHHDEPCADIVVDVDAQRPPDQPAIPTLPVLRGRLQAPPVAAFNLPRRTAAPDHGRPALMSAERLVEYYSGTSAYVDDVSEQVCPPEEVEQLWDQIYAGAGITDAGEKRVLRAQLLVYTMNNGCSPNSFTTRKFLLPGGTEVPLAAVMAYFANNAGTFRRFMRGMADEAVAYLKANNDFQPRWGIRNMGRDVYDRLTGFDYADGRTDLTPQQHAELRVRLEDILDRQSRSWVRSSRQQPPAGPLSGPVHAQGGRRRQRQIARYSSDQDVNLLED